MNGFTKNNGFGLRFPADISGLSAICILCAYLCLAGCEADYPEGAIQCTDSRDCPSGWTCGADSRCWRAPVDDDPSDIGSDAIEGGSGGNGAAGEDGAAGVQGGAGGGDAAGEDGAAGMQGGAGGGPGGTAGMDGGPGGPEAGGGPGGTAGVEGGSGGTDAGGGTGGTAGMDGGPGGSGAGGEGGDDADGTDGGPSDAGADGKTEPDCESLCTDPCYSCDVSDHLDTCTPVPAGTDPDDDCGSCNVCDGSGSCRPVDANEPDPKDVCEEAATTDACGQNGLCDGAGGCAYKLAEDAVCDTTCADGDLSIWSCTDERRCEVADVEPCPIAGGSECNPDGTDCRYSCDDDSRCPSATHFCCKTGDDALCDVANNLNECVMKLNKGNGCVDDRQCTTGHCIDAVCCTSASCPGDCSACNIPGASLGDCASYDDSDGVGTNDAPDGTCSPSLCRGCNGSSLDCVDVEYGEDWNNDCTAQPSSSCGYTGVCDGGACELYDSTTDCSDGNACTYGDKCNGSGGCAPGSPVTCDDDPATCGIKRSCNGTSECDEHYPGSETTCVDGDACTHNDRCNGSGGCSGTRFCWEDETSSLYWQNPEPGTGSLCTFCNWDEASDFCSGLELGGHSDWRLPLIQELISLVRGCNQDDCEVTDPDCLEASCNDQCNSCPDGGGPGQEDCYWDESLDGTCRVYWSDSPFSTTSTWVVNFTNSAVHYTNSQPAAIAWGRCVRGGT